VVKRVTANQAWGGNADCLNCAIRGSALFSGLTEDDFGQIHEPVEQVTLKPGELLYKVNDHAYHLFTVRSGLVKLVQYLPDGTQRIVRLVRNSDVVGLEALVSEGYEHEAVALRTTEVCRYPKEDINRLSRTNPVLHKDLMLRWQKALTDADTSLTRLSTGPARKRVANLLLCLVEDEATDCYLFSREDIGSILSITIETASRLISEFKRQGLIKAISHNHYDLDIPALRAIIEK